MFKKRKEVQDAVNAIKEHKRKQKLLYRTYYSKQQALSRCKQYMHENYENEFFMECVDMLPEVDVSDIFYDRKKLKYDEETKTMN